MILSVACLILGVLAYGVAGAQLHHGSRQEAGAFRSAAWWSGTGLQAAGFLFTLVARHSLPLLIVQACVVVSLAVTALIQHVGRVRRLGVGDLTALIGVLVGIAALSGASVPGPAPRPGWQHVPVLAAIVMLCGGAAFWVRTPGSGGRAGAGHPARRRSWDAVAGPVGWAVRGGLAGMGFSVGAIGARLLVGDPDHRLWVPWGLPVASWVIGVLTAAGLLLGQLQLTRGLASGAATTVLGWMYLVETLVPGAVGWLLLGERSRPGTLAWVVIGVTFAVVGGRQLLRVESDPVSPTPAEPSAAGLRASIPPATSG